MQLKQILLALFILFLCPSASAAQTIPAQTDIYNISLEKLQNITKDSLKTALKALQEVPEMSLSIDNLQKKYFLEVVCGDQFLGLQKLKELSSNQPTNYAVWNTYAWALFIAENFENAISAAQKSTQIHARQFMGADFAFIQMVNSAKGNIPTKDIMKINTTDFYDFLILQTTPQNTDTLISQIHYLIYNRLLYLPQQDSITAQLIMDAGDLIAKKDDRNQGVNYYNFAAKIDTSFKSKVNIRLDLIEDGKRTVKETFSWASIIWAIPLIALAFIGAATLKSYKKD